ncbi:MAG TPA: hypothetical protein VG168_10195 [Bryobacteraceae bacterium]|nr:hypothetical protein [Bryobacteraceae bacterium]
MPRLTAKTSTIFIATKKETRVYRSVAEVPARLRRRLHQSTSGINSATILIADRRGREELVRALQGLPSDVQSRLAENIRTRQRRTYAPRHRRVTVRMWLEILLPVLVGISLWLLIDSRFLASL